jgi:hypothetical protein
LKPAKVAKENYVVIKGQEKKEHLKIYNIIAGSAVNS